MIEQLYLLEPPYDRLRPAKPGALPVGAVITADLTGDAADRRTAVLDAVALQRESPWCPIGFVIDGGAPEKPLLEALERVPGSAAWVAGAVGARPMSADLAEAVRSRLEPDAAAVRGYIAARLGNSEPLAETVFGDIVAGSVDGDGDVELDRLRVDAGTTAQDLIPWEAVIETLLRRRGYVRDAENDEPVVRHEV
jgi:hypothetical protein